MGKRERAEIVVAPERRKGGFGAVQERRVWALVVQ